MKRNMRNIWIVWFICISNSLSSDQNIPSSSNHSSREMIIASAGLTAAMTGFSLYKIACHRLHKRSVSIDASIQGNGLVHRMYRTAYKWLNPKGPIEIGKALVEGRIKRKLPPEYIHYVMDDKVALSEMVSATPTPYRSCVIKQLMPYTPSSEQIDFSIFSDEDSESSFEFNSFVRNFSKKDESGKMYELVDACQEDDVTKASVLITQYPTLLNQTVILPNGIKCSMDMYAFIAACRAGCLDIAKLLLNESKSNVLLSRIIEEEDFGTKASVGGYALINALSNNHIHIAHWLLEESPNIIHSSISGILDFFSVGTIALIEACSKGHLEVVEQLVKDNPDLLTETITYSDGSKVSVGINAFIGACKNGHLEVANVLLQASPSILHELPDGSGITTGADALIGACQNGHLEVVEQLVKDNPDLLTETITYSDGSKVSVGINAFIGACSNGHLKVANVLLQASPSILQLPDGSGITTGADALIGACHNGHLEVVEQLLEDNPELLIETITFSNGLKRSVGATAFIEACSKGHLKVVNVLLKTSRSMLHELSDGSGVTTGADALIEACSKGHLEVVKQLVKDNPDLLTESYGSEVSVGITAFIEACKSGHDKIVKFLLDDCPLRVASRKRALLCALDQAFNGSNIKVATVLLERFPALIKELSLNTLIKTLAYQTFSRNCNVSEKHLTDQYESLWMERYELLSDDDKFMLRVVKYALENRKSKAVLTKIIPQFVPQEHIKESKDWITLIEEFAD